jgi:two-component system, OmpR family, sensor kinase
VPLGFSLRDRQGEEVRLQSRGQADVVAATASDLLAPRNRTELLALASTAASSVRGRVVVVDRNGTLIADSAGGSELGTNYARRPEIAAALRARRFQQTRHSQTLGEDLLATATPIVRNGRVSGAVRVTQSVAAVHRATRRSLAGLAVIAGVVLLLGLIAGSLIARQLARPLRRLEATAGEIAHGDLDRRAPVEGTSEQRSLARSFNEMTDRLSRALRAQREFVADASHQLRTPLTGLRLRLEEADAAAGGDAAVREELDAALGEVDRMSQMVNELLLLSSAGGRDAPAEAVDLAGAARSAAERWTAAAADSGIELSCDSLDGAGRVTVARADLDRALDVFVENALRYSPSGSAVQIRARGGRVEVLDGGPGVAPGEEEQVFDRFHRGRAGRSGPAGTGLGLPIARELMSRWGAHTSLANRPEGGARAAIEFDHVASTEEP